VDIETSLTIRNASGSSVVLEALGTGGGLLRVNSNEGKTHAELVTGFLGACALALGGSGTNGIITIRSASGTSSVVIDGRDGDIVLNREDGKQGVRLSGPLGDVILSGADAAEDFEIAEPDANVPAGTVMVIDDGGRLRQSSIAYDPRVAGVVSGAGEFRPGIVLGRQTGQEGKRPIALVGRTYCRVDATRAPISVGDLLTSATTPGHAMKADDSHRAQGAVLGKALDHISAGFGQIPILVALQ
jgi:hypothetical protein